MQKKDKTLLIFISLLFLINIAFSQKQDFEKDSSYVMIFHKYYHKDSIDFPYDPLDIGFKQISCQDNAFFISDTMYYDFYISDIRQIHGAYFITAHATIKNSPVTARIITFNENDFCKRRIKEGKKYSLKLQRYFEIPFSCPLEFRLVYNIIYSNHCVPLLATGSFNYLFFTENLKGLEYIEPKKRAIKENITEEQIQKVNVFLSEVIKIISFQDSSRYCSDFFDTSSVKKNLCNIYRSFYSFPEKMESKDGQYVNPWPIYEYPIKNLEKINWDIHNVDKNSFFSIFSKYIDLEIGFNFRHDKPNKVFLSQESYRFLSHDGDIYTMQVRWKTNTDELPLLATFAVKETSGHYKVVAIIVETNGGFNVRSLLFKP